ncbi:MAG: T9SS type A sorting domain-containing protein, partial [Crocinitomicaceae bacterium]
TQTDWVQEEVDLNDFIGQIIQLRFKLQSDGGVNQDGFYFDDFQLFFNADSIDRTGIEENAILAFKMYPNPANNSVQIQFNQNNNEGTLLITDFSGKLVKSVSLNDASQEMNVDLSDLSQGIYFINHKTEAAISECKKLVIAR